MTGSRIAATLALLLVPTIAPGIACAQQRDLCSQRPGLGTPACTVDPGHLLVETGLADWTREHDEDERQDTVLIGATLARLGIGEMTELQLGWTPYGHQRTRDRLDGTVERKGGTGDVTLGLKQNLANPDGHGFSVAVLPSVSLPVGHEPIGAGDWGTSVLVPVTYDLSDAVQLEFTPEVDAAVDDDGHGRHLAYSGVAGVEWDVVESVELVGEVQALRDRDPTGHTTAWLAALSAAWQPSHRLQLDLGAATGLNHDAPDLRVYTGIVALF
jgi:hypothetical protein